LYLLNSFIFRQQLKQLSKSYCTLKGTTHARALVCFSRLELLAWGLIPRRYFGLTIKSLIIEIKKKAVLLPIEPYTKTPNFRNCFWVS